MIISIGWQSAALKAAAFFEKPIIFYTNYLYPYEKHIFSFDQNKNKEMNKLCKHLWFDEKHFVEKFDKVLSIEKEFKLIQEISFNFIKEIGFYKNNLEKYFEIYLK